MLFARRRNTVSILLRLLFVSAFVLLIRQIYNSKSIGYSIGAKKGFDNVKHRPISHYHKQSKFHDELKAFQHKQEINPVTKSVLDLFGLKIKKDGVYGGKEDEAFYSNSEYTTIDEQLENKATFSTPQESLEYPDDSSYTKSNYDEQMIQTTSEDESITSDTAFIQKSPDVGIFEKEFFEMLEDRRHGVTKTPVDFDKMNICISKGSCMTFKQYKNFKAQQFIKEFANPFNKTYPPPTLHPYSDVIRRPDPLTMVKDVRMLSDEDAINEELALAKLQRLSSGDDDLLEMPEIQTILRKEKNYKVPNIIHFIWFGCHKYKVHHYTSMLSAVRYQNPSLILFHTNCIPNGTYWNAFVNSASTLKIVRRTPPTQIFGHSIQRVEHQSDVARLQILLEVGGIYMDDDIILLKSLDELRVHLMVLGEENYDALANSIILASRYSWFLHRWFQEYRYFNDSRWSDSSCFVPWSMWQLFPSTITVVKEKMLRPNWEEIKLLYHELWNWRNNYCIHLFSRFMKAVDGTEERSMQEIAVLNTTYGEISRHVIWGDYRIKDVSEWLFQ